MSITSKRCPSHSNISPSLATPVEMLIQLATFANRNEPPRKSRGRVDIILVKAGRGGKTVTVVQNFVGIGLPEKEKLAKEMQKTCGVGGTVKEGRIEIQGDKREEVARILTKAGQCR